METPVFAQKLGPGKWIGTEYVIDKCPVCCGDKTLKFTGMGMWGCTKCHKGGKNIQSFVAWLSDKPMMASIIESMKEPERPEELIDLATYHSPYHGKVIATGFHLVDRMLGGLTEGAMTVITGKRGEGKSTWLGQLALNAVNKNHVVCFYSGELSAGRFQNWLFSQAAGVGNMHTELDPFGAERWLVNETAEQKMREWLKGKFDLYDNTRIKAGERKTILRAFNRSRFYSGSTLFFVDNLMTARFDIDNEQDALRAQANFAVDMLDFARTNNVHVVLVAHPKKGEAEDINESVAGLSDITNMATNVIQIKKGKDSDNYDALVTIAKNREYGEIGSFEFTYNRNCRRFIPLAGSYVNFYGWENL